MGALWWDQARELRLAGKLQDEIADILGVDIRTLRKALTRMGVKAPQGRAEPSWRLMARDMHEQGATIAETSRRCGVSKTAVHEYFLVLECRKDALALSPTSDDFAVERYAERRRRTTGKKPSPVAGIVNPAIMDAARAFARGEITRDEMMRRLGKKPLDRGVYA